MSEPITLDRVISRAARSVAFRYTEAARKAPDDHPALLAYGTLALGAAMMCQAIDREMGVSTPGGRLLRSCAETLRVLSQQPGDHSQAIDALLLQLMESLYVEQGWPLTDEDDAEEVTHV
ncbi:MAG: hypothetical protein IPN92_10135 [Chromatiaceae bacterium]|nr:hypothetical protein [Chromatiaceae bacterium]